jgi:hypothetical protein
LSGTIIIKCMQAGALGTLLFNPPICRVAEAVTMAAGQGLALPRLTQASAPGAEESAAFPEGSSSVIESLTWRVAGRDPAILRMQAKALVEKKAGAVIVKDEEGLLVVSLPTQELVAFRQELAKLGSLGAPGADTEPSAPTTLLRLLFVQP